MNKLNFVLLRFRQHPYVITADIRSMYNCIKVPPSDRNALRFLWFKDGIVQQFRMTSHLFGAIWCSSCSPYALRKSVDHDCCENSVKLSVQNFFYVDDYLQSVVSIDYGVKLVDSIKRVLNDYGFQLTKCVANNPTLCNIPTPDMNKHIPSLLV